MPHALPAGVVLSSAAPEPASAERVLTTEAVEFVAALDRAFRARRMDLLERRRTRQRDLDAGAMPGFLVETRSVRDAEWQVATTPRALERRRVEITGPVDRKMMINALNSGADAFMADFEDALAPTWSNVVDGQANVQDAVRGTLAFTGPDGRSYALGLRTATLILRPRGWHLHEAHVTVDGEPISASLFDFGMAFFHNAREQLARGSGPYFYLPKLESHLEARLWNDVFLFAQEQLGVPRGSIRATVLIETILAAFEMDEILYELCEHAAGLNAGRWDYIFSIIKKFSGRPDMVLPDRAQITMTVPFVRAYTEQLVRTCHRRGAHAMGGMAAFVPNRRDAAVTENALAKVREDKLREAGDGFDGTWVAHPDLVPVAMAIFEERLGDRPNQKDHLRDDVRPDAGALLRLDVPNGRVTDAGLRANIDVALRYLDAWLRGSGAVAIHNLMEDAATAEIARAQLWQWVRHATRTDDGEPITGDRYRQVRDEALAAIRAEMGDAASRLADAASLLDGLVLAPTFTEFLTVPAYPLLDARAPGASADRAAAADDGSTQGGAAPAGTNGAHPAASIRREYGPDDVARLRGSVRIEHTLARRGAERLRQLLDERSYVHTIGALTGGQAVQMVRAGLEAIHVGPSHGMDDAPTGDVPTLVKRVNDGLLRADRIEVAESGESTRDWLVPIVAGAEAGVGGPIHAFELTNAMIEAGAAGVLFEDALTPETTRGHTGGTVLVPTSQFVRTLGAARLAADALDVPTLLIARTDALSATLLTSDVDERDRAFTTGERTAEGYYVVRASLEQAIARALAYAPYADLLCCETPTPDLGAARRFAEAIHAEHPHKPLAYHCSPSVDWRRGLDAHTIATFQRELAAIGYKLQLITRGGSHVVDVATFELAHEADGDAATEHQRGRGYSDLILEAITGGSPSTDAVAGSTEAGQFHNTDVHPTVPLPGRAAGQGTTFGVPERST